MTSVTQKLDPAPGSELPPARTSSSKVQPVAAGTATVPAADLISAAGVPSRRRPSAEEQALGPRLPVPTAAMKGAVARPATLHPAGAAPAAPRQLTHPPDLQRLSASYGLKPGVSLSHDLQSSDPKVRLRGLKALERAPGNWDPYIEMIADDTDPKIRSEILRVMLKHEDQMSPGLVQRMLTSELSPQKPPDRRFSALGLLSFVKSVEVGPLLAQYARDPDEKVRRSVVQTAAHRLEDISASDAHAVLVAQVTSDNPLHRLLVVELMAKKRSMPLSPYLAMCAGDTSAKLRRAMYGILGDSDRFLSLSGEDARTIFRAELAAPAAERRLEAIKFMKTLPRFDPRPLLQACLSDATSDDKVKRAAQKVLAGLG